MKKSTMAYVLIASLLVVAILAALAFRAAAARLAQAEDEARATARKDITDTLLSQTAMVADHVTLKVKEGTTEAQLCGVCAGAGRLDPYTSGVPRSEMQLVRPIRPLRAHHKRLRAGSRPLIVTPQDAPCPFA